MDGQLEPLVAAKQQQHQLAARTVRKFFLIFTFFDVLVLCAYAERILIPDPFDSLLHIIQLLVTIAFAFDVVFALAAVWVFGGSPEDGTWWARRYQVMRANYISNLFTNVALAWCQFIMAGYNAVPLFVAVGVIALRAVKYRPLIQLYDQIVLVCKNPDDPNSCDELFAVWAVKRQDKTQRVMSTFLMVSMAIVVTGLAGAACWDAMSGEVSHNLTYLHTGTSNHTRKSQPVVLLNAAPGHPWGLQTPVLLTECSSSLLHDAADGVTVGGATGGSYTIWGGPEAGALGGSVGALFGLAGGVVAHFNC